MPVLANGEDEEEPPVLVPAAHPVPLVCCELQA